VLPAQVNATQGICCSERCADGQYCKLVSVTVNQCVECVSSADCANGCNTVTGACNELRGNGEACTNRNECAAGGDCVLHYADPDNDDFATVSAAQARFCVSGSFNMPGQTTRQPGTTTTTDCFEGNADVHPGQTRGFTVGAPDPNGSHLAFDYDCNGREESPNPALNAPQDCSNAALGACTARGSWILGQNAVGAVGVPACGGQSYFSPCDFCGPDPTVCGGCSGGIITRECR
jgi:hypothetical protein